MLCLADAHCHLDAAYFDEGPDAVLGRARDAGVIGLVVVGLAVEGGGPGSDGLDPVRFAVDLARRMPGRVAACVGLHPHDASHWTSDLHEGLRALAILPEVAAVGEIGLDYHYDFAARDVQREVFAAQLALAQQLGRPVIIHTREATDDTFDILAQAGALRGVFHCFTGDAAMARRALDIGFFLSFSGILTFPKAESIREAARLVPDDRLLVETDSPYLAPVPFRGQRNEPAHVTRVVDALAALRGGTPSAMAERTSLNFTGLFGPC
jgi:TatD DNase family protein